MNSLASLLKKGISNEMPFFIFHPPNSVSFSSASHYFWQFQFPFKKAHRYFLHQQNPLIMQALRFPILFALCGLTFFFQSCSDSKNSSSDTTSPNAVEASDELAAASQPTAQFAKLKVESPFENLDLDFTNLRCNTAKSQTLRLESGTSIEVPAAAFVDEKGKPVAGQVDLQFREFQNPAEIIASGIPMKVVGENGGESWMQTAGMYEIKGSQNGKPVFVAPGKSLQVNLASPVGGAYDFWKFEPEKGNWDNFGVSEAVPNPAAKEAQKALAEIERQLRTPPAEPIAFDKSKPQLDFDIDYQAFPELKNKRGIIWQYAGNNSKEDPANNEWIFNTAWEDVKIEPAKQPGQYRLTLSGSDRNYQIPVCPTRSGKEMAQAKVDYEQQMAAYKKKLATLEASREMFQKQQAAFTRSFAIDGFGLYNYDILLKNEANVPILADFDFDGKVPEKMKSQVKVYLLTADGRAVVYFDYGAWDRFAFDPDKDNCLVAVLPGNKIATFSKKDFQQQERELKASKGQRYVFKMKVEEKVVESVAEIQKRLLTLG